ncbi:hypothetical protein KC332_g9652 [Hortaea werneckii]|nr:hypothetical protein KC358_g9556 [Hortaea werneckii]KAI6825441.1 hypothetical protein KC350_g8785 [Hortaea werneckii]KAI6922774.1 hypothetical protein KC348_g9708 [Hortaea werneckii]KAI6931989.1 hypothetical protein KC341_g9274 [Hortaea werneckii]KAI6966288.1 hypothetical protein KC321_g9642 [Hortaea werneckii]
MVFVRWLLLGHCNNSNKLFSVYDLIICHQYRLQFPIENNKTMASIQVPDENVLRGGRAINALEATKCPIQDMEDIQSAQGFNDYVDNPFDDVFYDRLRENGLYMVGWMTTEGLARTFKRHVFARWSSHEIKNTATGTRNRNIDYFVGPSIELEFVTVGSYTWYEIPTADHPYINFRGVPGTNLWVKVHDLSLIQFHPTYEGDNDGLRDVWRNIYTRMNDGTAQTTLVNPVEAQAMREMRDRDADEDDSEPEYPRKTST